MGCTGCFTQQIKRLAWVTTLEKLPRSNVGMEACLSAHFISRTLRKIGFEPRIIPVIYVKPFNKGQSEVAKLILMRPHQ